MLHDSFIIAILFGALESEVTLEFGRRFIFHFYNPKCSFSWFILEMFIEV